MPKLFTIFVLFILGMLAISQPAKADTLTLKTALVDGQLNLGQAALKSDRTITISLDLNLKINGPREPKLILELADARQFVFGALNKAGTSTPIPADSDFSFTGKFVGLPEFYKGTARFLLVGEDGASRTFSAYTSSFGIFVDTEPPRVTSVRPIEDAFGAKEILITIADRQLLASYPKGHFGVKKYNDESTDLISGNLPTHLAASNGEFRIQLKESIQGTFKVTIGRNDTTEFTDIVGNVLAPVTVVVSAGGQRAIGPAVDFPPNVIPQKAERHSETNDIRPSSRVVTRVVRLYYYRNAERVAEIINRRTQQYNAAQANARKTLAEQLGEQSEAATAERRDAERLAEQAARKTRVAEAELQTLQVDAEESKTLQRSLTGFPDNYLLYSDEAGNVRALSPAQATASGVNAGELMTVTAFKDQLQKVIDKYQSQQDKVADLRAAEFEANNKAKRNEDTESRLIRSQFLKEVEAAETDPATYAKGEIDSVDPVMQTSVSVIGEGVIQLRGPIGGINQIRRMIHQIDMPVGQVKVDMETIQINGEKGPELEKTVQLVEGYINVGRFLTNQSLVFLCRSVTEIAAEVAQENGEPWQRDQLGRDMRYLYGFFGQDFVDTLHRMDSEFLHSENQILSLHSMDAISRNRALLLIGLAKNSVRQRILERFQQYVGCTLPQMEFNYRTINQSIPCKYLPDCCEECKESVWKVMHVGHKVEVIRYTPEMAAEDAQKNYQFLNFYNFFAQGIWHDASLNPVQREFIRLAQVFKSQLISEIELKQRVVERGLMDQKNSDDKIADEQGLLEIRKKAVRQKNDLLLKNTEATSQVASTIVQAMSSMEQIREELNKYRDLYQTMHEMLDQDQTPNTPDDPIRLKEAVAAIFDTAKTIDSYLVRSKESIDLFNSIRGRLVGNTQVAFAARAILDAPIVDKGQIALYRNNSELQNELNQLQRDIHSFIDSITVTNRYVERQYDQVLRELESYKTDWKPVFQVMQNLEPFIPVSSEQWRQRHHQATGAIREMIVGQIALKATQDFLDQNRLSLPQLKLLDHLIDEHEEKSMNLLEGTRSHISAIDNFLKRMTYALEDDFQVQFYDPSLTCIRTASRQRRVTFSQVERTTVLGNNRELLKVLPQATMEFDLPNRKLRVTEAMKGAKALVDDYGALLNDPTFLSAYQMMGGGAPAESVRKILPGLPSDPNQKFHALPASQSGDRLGASLQGLVPDPEIYQIETGTGFEVRPVIQPDGDSMVYDLNYMYHTEMREPVRADEKHLGRIKRHLLHTQVQTSSFELREVGRYQVALKVSRTARGVPMLENAPVVGALFRPAPSTESSIQQNILLAKSVIYPTLYDLMGLGWAQHVAELGYDDIRNAGHVSRGRQQIIQQHVFDSSSRNVDDFLQINEDAPNHRPDLYREHSIPSPYHPNGFVYPKVRDEQDPTRRGFRVPESRPEQYRSGTEIGVPAQEFDNRFRLPVPQENGPALIEEYQPSGSYNPQLQIQQNQLPAPVPMIRRPGASESVEPVPQSSRQRPNNMSSPQGAPVKITPSSGPMPVPTLQLNSMRQQQPSSNASAVVTASATVVQPSTKPMATPTANQPTTNRRATINQPQPKLTTGNPVVPANYQVEQLPPPPRR